MILWGFLAGRYALDVPLALAATLVFEQSYGGVDGDSASSAELYALLSALSDVPIKQSLAVTGSVNQWGEVQAIGGVNEKIEGFFDVCRARGLNEQQGVLIPKSNVQHLMLREDVVEAVRNGQFAIYPVGTIDEGIEILTGVKAGERGAEGRFPAGTINRLVEDKLRSFAERGRGFAKGRRSGRGAGEGRAMIAHVAETGEDRGRVVLQLGSGHPSAIALEAAVRIARAFQSEIESLFVEDEQLFDCAAYGFVREVSLTGRQQPGACRRRHDARPAPGGAGRAAADRGAGAPGRGAAALARGARRAAARAVDRLRRDRAVERGGAGRAVHRRQRRAAEAAAGRDRRAPPASSLVGPKARRVTGPPSSPSRTPTSCPTCCGPPSGWRRSTAPRSCCCWSRPTRSGSHRMDGEARLVVEAREDVRIAVGRRSRAARRP